MTTLAFWHGWGMSPAVWTDLAERLRAVSPADTACRAMPLPGYAGTALPADTTPSSWADALMAPLSGRVILCGWSMGAILALSAACLYPEKVERLVLFGATPCFVGRPDWPAGMRASDAAAFREGVAADPAGTLRRFITLFNRRDRQARAIVRRLTEEPIPPTPVLLAGLAMLEQTDLRAQIPAIRQPVLLIHGENDPLMPPEAARWLADTLPDARLHLLPDVAHAPFLSDPGTCARLIGAFLGKDS